MAQALLHSTVEMTVLPLCLIKKKTTCMVTAVATYPTYHTYLVAAQADVGMGTVTV